MFIRHEARSMNDTNTWLEEFGQRLASARNPIIYWLSLLVLMIGVTGLLWSLPVPGPLREISPLINFGSLFLMAASVYYFVLSLSLGAGMLPFVMGIAAIQGWLAGQPVTHSFAASVLIGAGVSGLCFGHYAAGGLRAVSRDVQLVMIAPAWVLSIIYRRMGIPI